MASNQSVFGSKPKWPGQEAHLSDGTGSESEVRFSVHSTASKGQQAKMEPSRAQGLRKSAVSPGRGAVKEVQLDEWDPMEDDFNDNGFNSYNSGLLGNNQHQGGNRDAKYKLFVGNIPSEMTEDGLFNLFSQICDIKFTKVIPRKDNTGYGFVEVPSVKDGEEAIRRLDGHKIRGYGLRVSFARERTKSDAPGPRQLNPLSQANVDQPWSKAKLTNGTTPTAGWAHSSSADADGYTSSGSNGKRKTPELRKVENRYGNVAKVTSPKVEPSIKSPTSSALASKAPSSKLDNPVVKSPLQSLLQKMKYPLKTSPASPEEMSQNEPTSKISLKGGQNVTRSEARGTGEVKSVGAASREIQFEGSPERMSESEELIAKLKAGGVHVKGKVSEERETHVVSQKVRTEAVRSPHAADPKPLLSLPIKANPFPPKPSDAHQSEVSSVHQSKHQEAGHSNASRGILGPFPRDPALHQGQVSQPHGPSSQGYHPTCANCSQCDTEGHEPSPYHQPQHPWNGPYRYPNPHAQYAQAPEGYPNYPYQHSMPLRYPHQYGPDPYSYAPQYGSVPPSGHTHSYGQHFRYGTPRRGMHRGNFHRGDARFHRDHYPSGYKSIPHKPHSHPTKPQSKWEENSSRAPEAEADAENGAPDRTLRSRRTPEPVAVPKPAGRPSEDHTGKATTRRLSQRGTDSESDSPAPKLCMNCKIKPGELIGDHCCSRCKGLYCSKECQREHWPTHKKSCRQASTPDRSPKASSPKTTSSPKTVSSPRATSSAKTTTTTLLHGGAEGQFMARNLPFEMPDDPQMEVFVTEVDSPGSLWLQVYKERTLEGFGKLTQALNDTYQGTTNSGEFSCTPKVGGVCAVQYSQDVFYRGEVLSIKDDNAYPVLLLDFGITDIVAKQDLRKLKDELLTLPKQALKCFLSGIKSPQGAWSEEATQKLQSLVKCKKCTVEFKGQGAEGREIELYDPEDSSLSVSSALVSAGLAQSTRISAPSAASSQPASTTTTSPPSLGSISVDLATGRLIEVCISHVDSPGCFYANVVDRGSDLLEMGQNINDFYSETPAQAGFSPKLGDLCAARFSQDNCWYRAVVQKAPHTEEKGLYVNFIDYGNSDVVSPDECRPLEERFAGLPKQAIQCKLAGVKPQEGTDWQDDMTGAFREWLAAAPTVNLIIRDKKDDNLVVEVFSAGAEEPDCSFNTILLVNGFADEEKRDSVTDQAAAQASGDSVSTNQMATKDQLSASGALKPLLEAVVPETKFEGFITSVHSPLDFYLQVFSRENMVAFEALTNLLNTRYSLQDPIPFTPTVGDFCAVKSIDDAWYRALIREQVAPESAYKVLFVDYGVEEVASSERITLLEDRFFDTPIFAVHCGLACVQTNSQNNQNERMIAFFTEKVKEKQFQVEVVRKEKNKCLVELIYPDGNKEHTTIQQDLSLNGWASLLDVSPSNQVMPRTRPPNQEVASVPTAKPPKDFPGYVSAVGDHGDLYIQEISQTNLEAVNELTEKLNAHYGKMQRRPHEPSIGEACVAKYSVDDNWYRVRVVELRATEAKVLFVDYGNTETVSLAGIKKLQGDFLAIPQCCHHCYLSGVSVPSGGREWDSDATDTLRKMVTPEDEDSVKGFQVSVKKQDGEACEVVILYSTDGGDTWSSVNDDLIAHFQSPGPSGDHLPANGELPPPPPSSTASEGLDRRSGGSVAFETLPAGDSLTGNCVCLVTVVNDPSDFFIQISSEENIELDERLGIELRAHYEDGSVSPHEPQIGQLCAARFSADNAWYRARAVEEVAPESALKVMFEDYGNVEVVAQNEIRKLEGWLREVPKLAHRCGIHGMIAPSGGKQMLWSEETIQHIKSKLENAMCTVDIVKKNGKVYEVEILYSSQEGQWVNIKEELQELGLAEPVAPPITSPEPVRASPITSPEPVRAPPTTSSVSSPITPRDGRILTSSLKKVYLPTSAIDIVVNEVVSTQEFYCQMCIREDNEKLLTLMNDIQEYASKLPPDTSYQPAIGDLCLAKFTDNFWYRGEVVKIKRSSQKALVKYIDFGNMEPLPWSQVRAASEVFAKMPIHAIKCGLSGVPLGASSPEEGTKKFLQEQLSGVGSPVLHATFQEMTADGTSLVQLVEPESKSNINQIVAAYLKDAKQASSPDPHGTRSRTPNGPVVSPKVITPGASPKVMTSGASPRVTTSGASPKVMSPDPAAAAQEAKRRETERKKRELEAKIEAQRRQLAEMELEIASLDQGD